MRNLRLLDIYRDTSPAVLQFYGHVGDETCGVFWVPSPLDHAQMRVIASSDEGWDHVSVSRKTRTPNWPEMEHVKRLFFRDGEVAMQLHVAVKDHVNCHPHCLHIWRPSDGREIPLPPAEFVGPAQEQAA